MGLLIKILRKPLFTSTDKRKAMESQWIWNEDYSGQRQIYHLSILSIINTFMVKINGNRLAVIVSNGKKPRLSIIKPIRR